MKKESFPLRKPGVVYISRMKANIRPLVLILILVMAPLALHAEEPRVFSVDDTEELLAQMGKEAVVEGRVRSSFWVRGVLLITFREEQEGFVGAAFARNRDTLNEAFDGDIARALRGKNIRMRGTITEHRSRPQIVVENPDQITVLEE